MLCQRLRRVLICEGNTKSKWLFGCFSVVKNRVLLCKTGVFFLYQLQKSKEREERLEEVIQAYEKIHLEKSNVQRDLDKMVSSPPSASARGCNLRVPFQTP